MTIKFRRALHRLRNNLDIFAVAILALFVTAFVVQGTRALFAYAQRAGWFAIEIGVP